MISNDRETSGGLPAVSDKKALVVGGGITGCAAALDLSRLGFLVTVCEAKPRLGGILTDLVDGPAHFFGGCQYLSANEPWTDALPAPLKEELYGFKHVYGSHTWFDNKGISHDDFAAPVFDVSEEELARGAFAATVGSLQDRLSNYPPCVADHMTAWVRRLGRDPAEIDGSNGPNIQIERLYLRGCEERTSKMKAGSESADALLGLPRSTRIPDLARPQSLLPSKGFDAFFEIFADVLTSGGIDVRLGHPAIPKISDGELVVRSRGEILDFDLIVWAANPIPLIQNVGLGRLDNPFVDVRISAGFVSGGELPQGPHYIQVYSDQTPVTRIFYYRINGAACLSVEHFQDADDTGSLEREVERICAPFYGEVDISFAAQRRERRHIFFSPRDRTVFADFRKLSAAKYPNLVDGAWDIYARDKKISAIASGIRERLPLLER